MKQTMFKAFVFAGLYLVVPAISHGQQQTVGGGSTDPKLTPSLTAGAGTIGSIYSPNLFNGTANINIPIYEYSSDAGNLGVSLGYNTAGVKVDEKSSLIGLHWNLNAGGGITRVMKDMPDEINISNNTPAGLDSLSEYSRGVKGKWAAYIGSPAVTNDNARYKDGESDDFLVSIGNLSFSFNIGAGGFVFTHPHRNVKVTLLVNGALANQMPLALNTQQNNVDISFLITDEQGNKYYFTEGTRENREYTNGNSANQGTVLTYEFISQWNIDKIVLANGSEVTYSYSSAGATPALYKAFSRLEGPDGFPAIGEQAVDADATIQNLAAIHYPNNVTATFIYNTSPTTCDWNPTFIREIRILSGDNCLRYRMDQVYAVAANSIAGTPDTVSIGGACVYSNQMDYAYRYHRLTLKGITLLNCDGSTSEPYYSFEYDVMKLPPLFSGAQDYFGYYNGQNVTANGGQLTIPTHTEISGSTTYGVSKDHNAVFATAGILRAVRNAYGGKVSFGYEGHNLSNNISGLPSDAYFLGKDANDGVRLKYTEESDVYHPGNTQYTEYTYSGGQRFLTGGYFHFPYTVSNTTSAISAYLFNGIYVSPHQLINGSNHGYSNVTITAKDQSGNLLSKKTIQYSNFSQANMLVNGSNKNYYQLPFTDKQYIKDWEIGNPLQIEEYDQNNQIISRTINTYEITLDNTSAIGKVENKKKLYATKSYYVGPIPYTTIYAQYAVDSDAYRPYTGYARPEHAVMQKFIDNGVAVNDTVWYTYDGHNNLKTTRVRNSKGQYFFTNNVYTYDVGGTGAGNTLNNLANMEVEKVVSTERWKTGSNLWAQKLFDASITGYDLVNGKILMKRQHLLSSNDPVNYTDYTGSTQANPISPYGKIWAAYNNQAVTLMDKTSEVQLYDVKGNPVETQLLGQQMFKAMIWDTATGQKLADANCRYSDMAYSGFEVSTKGNWNYNAASVVLSSSVPSGGIDGKYALRVLNTDPSPISVSGLTVGKEYIISFWLKGGTPVLSGGGLSNIPLTVLLPPSTNSWTYMQAKFTPSNNTPVGFVPNGSNYYIDDIRLHPSNAQMQSWSYQPLFGVSSSSDATGRITYFEYDAFGRVNLVRDQEGNIRSKTEYHVAQ
jgi:YD repeat-containing protein